MDAELGVAAGLQERAERVTGVDDAVALGVGLRVVLALGDVAVLDGDVVLADSFGGDRLVGARRPS
jgi:hypothetical protein